MNRFQSKPLAPNESHIETMSETHRLQPGSKVDLSQLNTDGKRIHPDRQQAEAEFETLREELVTLQNRWYADGSRSLLVVFQAMDAGGKDGTIRRVFRGVNPQGVRVASFKSPSKKELSHDFLWRIHQQVPGKGMIGIFNRSHYEDVLVVRVDEIVPKSVWKSRYQSINNFEKMLTESGTSIIKFYLHISKSEQKKRFQARLDDATKQWKFARHDLEKRKQWDAYQEAYEEMLYRCSTEHAPWYIIPADQKWYRNLAISRVLVQTLRELNPQFPTPEDDLDKIERD